MQRQALRVAMAVAPYRRVGTGAADEGVVLGHGAIAGDADDLAVGFVELLGAIAMVTAFADAGVEEAIAADDDARAEVLAAVVSRLLPKQHAQVRQRARSQSRAGDGGVRAIRCRSGIGEIQRAIAGEVGIEHHVEQATLAVGVDLGYAGQRRTDAAIRFDDAHRAAALGDQEPVVGQEGHGPGAVQATRDGVDLDRAEFAVDHFGWRRVRRQRREQQQDQNAHAPSPSARCRA